MVTNRPTVFVVDKDLSVRTALEHLFESKGCLVQCFTSAEEFLKTDIEAPIACIVAEVNLPGLNGLELQDFILQRGDLLPIVFMSGHADIATVVRAIKAGALGFLAKPFVENELFVEIEKAFAVCRNELHERLEIAEIKRRHSTLTNRESEILFHVVSGKLNKQTASELGIVEDTVKVHRRRVMRKMMAKSVAELVLMAQKLDLLADNFYPMRKRVARSEPAPLAALCQKMVTARALSRW